MLWLMRCVYELTMMQILGIARSQRQVMHQLDNISSLVREDIGGGRSEGGRRERKSIMLDIEPTRVPLILALAVGGLGIFLFKAFLPRNWIWKTKEWLVWDPTQVFCNTPPFCSGTHSQVCFSTHNRPYFVLGMRPVNPKKKKKEKRKEKLFQAWSRRFANEGMF